MARNQFVTPVIFQIIANEFQLIYHSKYHTLHSKYFKLYNSSMTPWNSRDLLTLVSKVSSCKHLYTYFSTLNKIRGTICFLEKDWMCEYLIVFFIFFSSSRFTSWLQKKNPYESQRIQKPLASSLGFVLQSGKKENRDKPLILSLGT